MSHMLDLGCAIRPKTCPTCTKRRPGPQSTADTGCQVLNYRIGERGECFAWSDNPDWEAKANAATMERYGFKARRAAYQRELRAKKKGVR